MSTPSSTGTRLGELLARAEIFSSDQIHELLTLQRGSGDSLARVVLDQGYATEDHFLRALAQAMDIEYFELGGEPIDPEVLSALPAKAVYQYNVIPITRENGLLRVATNDPFRPGLADGLRLASGLRIRFVLCLEGEIEKAIKRFYGIGGETIERMIEDGRIEVTADEDHLDSAELEELDEEASVVKFVNQIIWEAYEDGSTDIHLEPMEKDLRIRYRIDGVLHQTPVPPQLKRFQPAIISRIKVMSNMDIAEKRLPQDGRISLRIRGEEIDIRVSTMPTVYGESVSLRLLMRNAALIGLGKLGLHEDDAQLMERIIHKPHGIVLVTGPTGSGKSTSLYAYLNTINSIDKRLITTEDPIEYHMAGINQIQIKPEIGLTFAVSLRHILRQDPDVIMIGEVRDKETADIAVQASLTGHLVFSTLHTNDAASGFTRLLDMGIEPFLVASSIEAMVAQRLVRVLCPDCRHPVPINEHYLKEIQFPIERLSEGSIYEPAGCEACRNTGFKGRTGIYEILVIDDQIRPLVVSRESASRIKQQALKAGMRTLRDDGWRKVLEGITSIDEVLRVSEENEEIIGA